MSNKSRLQTNNTNLQALIDKANALPDAGGSGGGSAETVTIIYSSMPEPGMEICYLDGSLTYVRAEITKNAEYSVLKGSILVLTNYPSNTFDEKCTHIVGNSMCRAFLVTG